MLRFLGFVSSWGQKIQRFDWCALTHSWTSVIVPLFRKSRREASSCGAGWLEGGRWLFQTQPPLPYIFLTALSVWLQWEKTSRWHRFPPPGLTTQVCRLPGEASSLRMLMTCRLSLAPENLIKGWCLFRCLPGGSKHQHTHSNTHKDAQQ